MFFLIVFSLLVALLGVWTLSFWQKYKHLKHIPSPPMWPVLGNALEFNAKTDTLTKFENWYKEYKTKSLRIHIGFRTIVQTIDPNILEHLLNNHNILSKGQAYDFLARWLNTGLLTSSGEKWRRRRKMITPTFHFHILEQFVDVFDAKSKTMIEKLKKEAGKDSVDVFPIVTLCALDIICETAMGTSADAQSQVSSEYTQCVKSMGRLLQLRAFNPLFQWDFIYKFSNLYKTEIATVKVIQEYTDNVIQKRREQLLKEQSNNTEAKTDDLGIKKRTAFLDMLLQSTVDGVPLTNDDIKEEVNTFMFAGHDTTSAATSYCLYLLASHPDIQQKVLDEQKEIYGEDKMKNCTLEDLNQMKYLELVMKETLRLYPSAPLVARKATHDIQLGDLLLPEDTAIGVNIFLIHRDPEVYPDPLKFDPERFNPANGKSKHYSYIPFSAGPRNCVGQKYALLEMKCLLSNVIRNFKLSPATPKHELNLRAETVLKSVNGVKIRLDLRP